MISAFFDESAENDSRNGLLAVSGYALDVAGVIGLTSEWQELLRSFGLPYFHMSECNANDGIFGEFSKESCDKCARRAIRIARQYPLHGYAIVLDQSDYRRVFEDEGFNCDPYTFLLWTAMIHVKKWVDINMPHTAISLFFEKGYRTESRANELLRLSARESLFNYAFVDKVRSEPIQAADLIAWHIRKGRHLTKDR